jgi:hypothetical protein
MSNAAITSPDQTPTDPEVETVANVLKAALNGLPENKRRAAADRLVEMLTPPKAPTKPGPVLGKVIELFKQEQRAEWAVSEVLDALASKFKDETQNKKQVYGALTYLSNAKILRRVGYGRYLIEGGGLLTDIGGESF